MSDEGGSAMKSILLMGLRNSGKTSIHRVVFEGAEPHDTIHQETTTRPTKVDTTFTSFVSFHIWDFPGQTDFLNSANFRQFLETCGAIIFVVDMSAEETLQQAQEHILDVVHAAIDFKIMYEVFLHKADKLSQENQDDINRRLSSSITEQIHTNLEGGSRPQLHFHTTSIYDHSVFKGFSVVVQKVVPQLPFLRSVIDMLRTNSRLQQAMLFDKRSKIFLAEDNGVLTTETYDLFFEALQITYQLGGMFEGEQNHHDADEEEGNLMMNGDDGGTGEFSSKHKKDAYSLFHFGNGMTVYVKDVSEGMAVVLGGDEAAFVNRSLIDYNVGLFSKAVRELFSAGN